MKSRAELFAEQLAQQYEAAPESNPVNDIKALFGGPKTRTDIMRQAKELGPLLQLEQSRRAEETLRLKEETEARKAQTEQQNQILEVYKALHGQINDFHKLPEDVQNAQRASRIKEFKVFGRVLGNAYDDTDAQAFFTTPGYADKMMATVDPFMSDERRQALRAKLGAEPDPAKRQALMDADLKATEQEAVDFVKQALPLIPSKLGNRKDITRAEVRVLAKSLMPELSDPQKGSRMIRRAFETVLADDKLMSGFGVIPAEVEIGAQKKAADIKAESMAKLGTPQGRAEFKKLLTEIDNAEAQGDLTRANTAKAKIETLLAPIKTIPGAGGALVDVSGAMGGGGTVAQTPTTEGPATTGPGVRTIAQTPGPPAGSETVRDLVRGEKIEQALERSKHLQNDKTLQSYVGPKTSRPLGALIQMYQERSPGGKLPDSFVRLQQSAGELKNYLIQEITGAAVRPDEEPRIMAEAPDITADKWDAFWQKYKQTQETVKAINLRKKELYSPDGRLKVGVDPAAVARKHPLPKEITPPKPGEPGSPFVPVR